MLTPRIDYSDELNRSSSYLEGICKDIDHMRIAMSVLDRGMQATAAAVSDLLQNLIKQIKQRPIEQTDFSALKAVANQEIQKARENALNRFRGFLESNNYPFAHKDFSRIEAQLKEGLERDFGQAWDEKIEALIRPIQEQGDIDEYCQEVMIKAEQALRDYQDLLSQDPQFQVADAVKVRYMELKGLKEEYSQQIRTGLKTMNVFLAAQLGHVKYIEEALPLFRKSAFLNKLDSRGFSMLHIASYGSQPTTVKYLLQKGAKHDLKDKLGYQSLHWAINNGAYGVCCALIDAGADVNAKGEYDRTPLHNAVFHGHINLVTLLLNQGAEINAQTDPQGHGVTPLFAAVTRNNVGMVRLLCGYDNLDVTIRDTHGHTVMHYATQSDPEIIEELKKHKSNVLRDASPERL